MGIIKIFLDDLRKPPNDEWLVFRTGEECLEYIKLTGLTNISHISFDNDLGLDRLEGYQVLDMIEEMVFTAEEQLKSVPVLSVHSANPTARARMGTVIERIRMFVEYPS